MGAVLPVARADARELAAASDSDQDFSAASGSEYREWFYPAVLQICGRKDPGYQLHLYTGWPLSSCRKYCARDALQRRGVSEEFLRILFRSRHGGPFFRAFMAGCTAPWFADLVAAEARASDAEAALRDIHERSRPK